MIPLAMENCEPSLLSPTDLSHCHAYLVEMSQLLQNMDVLHRTYSAPAINAIQVRLTLFCSPSGFCFSFSCQPLTNSGMLSGHLLQPNSRGLKWSLCYAFILVVWWTLLSVLSFLFWKKGWSFWKSQKGKKIAQEVAVQSYWQRY